MAMKWRFQTFNFKNYPGEHALPARSSAMCNTFHRQLEFAPSKNNPGGATAFMLLVLGQTYVCFLRVQNLKHACKIYTCYVPMF